MADQEVNWIDPENVRVDVCARDWREAVRLAGELLVQAGYVQPGYIEGMLRTVEELGPYIVIAPGIAMPHARPEDGVISPGFAVIRLQEGVCFGNPDNDPVHLVIAFCATDHESHVETLARLARSLSRPDINMRLDAAVDRVDLAKVLNGTD